jgi:hypothetical protein
MTKKTEQTTKMPLFTLPIAAFTLSLRGPA